MGDARRRKLAGLPPRPARKLQVLNGVARASARSMGSLSTLGLLGVELVGLKLVGLLSLSWFWVTLPLWIAPALILAFGAFPILVGLVLDELRARRARSSR